MFLIVVVVVVVDADDVESLVSVVGRSWVGGGDLFLEYWYQVQDVNRNETVQTEKATEIGMRRLDEDDRNWDIFFFVFVLLFIIFSLDIFDNHKSQRRLLSPVVS